MKVITEKDIQKLDNIQKCEILILIAKGEIKYINTKKDNKERT